MSTDASATGKTFKAADGRLPQELSNKEKEDVLQRRRKAGLSVELPPVGAALSGGGIRSATFCLGLLQGLAKKDLLRRVDYLSTVSGGGYIGGFFGRMFTRDWATTSKKAEDILNIGKTKPGPSSHRATAAKKFAEEIVGLNDPQGNADPVRRVTATLKSSDSPPLVWLRESGNYIAPGGANDGALAAGAYLRNWLSLLVVLLTAGLTFFLSCNLLRAGLEQTGLTTALEARLLDAVTPHIWWTPAVLLPAIFAAVWLVPLGMAYWLTQKNWAVWLGYVATLIFSAAGYFALGFKAAGVLAVMIGIAILIRLGSR